MSRKGLAPEKVIARQREAEVLPSQGQTVGQIYRRFGIMKQTYYRWRKEYGGLRMARAKRMKELEKENERLRKLVADLSLGKQILKEASAFASKNF